ncbi:serine/threonine-protein kinase H1 homolog [Limulus polyphemus]|uniref:Serine/threonine-protein kinase H1 homolog n=1 Tax=Limulus polyphemus TaxID=6850 RepID=A0ABM1B8L9_LIMPO|nr:serine/threonine-protein kinase H1 homolog [Limulus polyphemus]
MGCKDSKLEKDVDFENSFRQNTIKPVYEVIPFSKEKVKKVPADKRRNQRAAGDTSRQTASTCNIHSNDHSRVGKGRRKRQTGKTNQVNRSYSKTIYDPRITARYNIKAVIGKGSFSRVIRVEHRITKQPYAIKLIEAPEGKEVFEAELSVLRRVNHPNVIRLVEVFESNDKIYMVMELATGGNLLDRIEAHGYFVESDAIQVLKMMLCGVSYLHSLGITHRDLKPDNLLYYHPGNDSRIMITDFGFASTRKPNGNVFMHTVCGTPQYIAPEIVSRQPYTCAVDMWAVGVITFILLSGTFPFDAKQDAVILKLVLKGSYSLSSEVWEEVSDKAKDFVRVLLLCDPQQRLTAVQALKHPWIAEEPGSPSLGRRKSATLSAQGLRYTASQKSGSGWSRRSGKSVQSLRSGHRRVEAQHLEALQMDPEVGGMIK